MVSQILIPWLVIYPLDSTIQLLTNWGQDLSTCIISQLKKPLSICQSDGRVTNSKQISGNSLNPLEAQNKDISAASRTSSTKIRLHLCLDQTEALRAPKKIFGRPGPRYLRIWMTPSSPPPPSQGLDPARQKLIQPVEIYNQSSNTLLAYFVRFNYKTDLINNLTGSARIIPVFNYSHMEGKSGAVKSIQIPPLKG